MVVALLVFLAVNLGCAVAKERRFTPLTFPAKDLLHKRGFQCLDQLVNETLEFYDLRQTNRPTAM